MAKRLLLLHIGPDPVDVSAMTDGLALGAIAVPDAEAEAFAHAGIEIRRAHKAAGLKRKQVEGAWASVCRRAYRTKADCFVSVPDFFGANHEQAALALDHTVGFKVVLVVTSGFDVEPPAPWMSLVKDGRTHVLPSHLSDEQLAAQVARIALIEEEARLDKRIAKIGKLRKQVNKRLAA
ncbi:hypothetical protein SAMN05192575_101951 [Nocardioides alpinus]|uniref:Uncharacterized protein n=1 Tax=Nocardioides alpinus TaxID=748909 RepID=A0A1I0WFK6_9ACTN|nr:hypothetical protein [Nocardioides alpinus]PKH37881.1 hypothetical protein CXG46_21075 [Nocardioides alpinus]SFA87177.1 hypothetical protein SAMN05192575_101951 [Nocardioides alpinus]